MKLKIRDANNYRRQRLLKNTALALFASALSSTVLAEDLEVTVTYGQNLGAISLRHTNSVHNANEIAAYNNLTSADLLTVGETLVIPRKLLVIDASSAAKATPTPTPTPTPVVKSPAANATTVEQTSTTHTTERMPVPSANLEPPTPPEMTTRSATEATAEADSTQEVPEVSKSPEAPMHTDTPKQSPPPQQVPKGLFDIDEEAAKRALERSLSKDNAVLLRYGQAEIGLSYSYAYDETLSQILVEQDGQISIATGRTRACFHGLEATLRTGLPWDAQLEIGLPYKYNCATTDLSTSSQYLESFDSNGSGSGDARLALLKTIASGAEGGPSIVARIFASPGNGKERDGDFSLGGGTAFSGLGLQMTARQDPMVYTLGFSATQFSEDDNNQPGNQYNFSARTYLSTSPSNSISLGLSNTIVRQASVDQIKIGPDGQMYTYLNIGFSSVLASRNFISVDISSGLNEAALDLSLAVGWTKQFGWSKSRQQ